MPLIYIPTIPSHKLNQVHFQNKSSTTAPGLSIGEILNAAVIEKLGSQKILITLKGINIPATSEVNLNAGDTIRVKVENLNPQVILKIIGRSDVEESRAADFLKWYRANPDALSQIITEAFRQFNSENVGKLSRYLPKEDFQNLLKIIKSLFNTPEVKGGNFVKDYLSNLGLLTESQLRKVVEGQTSINENDYHQDNLKSLLMKLSDDLHNLLARNESFDPEVGARLKSLSEFVDRSIKTIESQQIVNFVLQETESKYLFQIPILFPDGVRKRDIFVEYDRNTREGEFKGQYRIIFFLDMDMLGEMIIEAEMKGDKIDCLIKCSDHKISDFISPFLGELRESLTTAGCEINTVKCITGDDLTKEKFDYYQDRALSNRDVIDLFV
ncbi:MAG TPA: hypothetical protein VMT12_03995 [Syntrophales bacterium]|nr:hypothetical protein [Syntrophales bacterium]